MIASENKLASRPVMTNVICDCSDQKVIVLFLKDIKSIAKIYKNLSKTKQSPTKIFQMFFNAKVMNVLLFFYEI